jgi:hypothetical protein
MAELAVRTDAILVGRETAATLLGVTLSSFNEHVAGELPKVRIGTRVLYRVRSLEQWAERNETFGGRSLRAAS